MSGSDAVAVDLDVLGEEMLLALDQHGGSATTSEIREFLGIDSHTKINYRIREVLTPQDLITTHQPDGTPGNIPPKELTLTEKGSDVVDQLEQKQGRTENIADRLTRLEEQVQSLREENQHLRAQLDSQENSSPSTAPASEVSEEDIESLQEQVGSLAMQLEDLKEDLLFQDEIRRELDAVRTGTLAMRDLLIEEEDAQQYITQRVEEYQDEITLLSTQNAEN